MTDENAASERERQVNRILADYLEAQRRGQAPDREDLLRRHPELAEELRSFFADQDRFGRVAERIGPPAVSAQAPAQGPTQAPSELADTGAALETVPYFGDYELLEEIASGGMGIVFKARQVSLNRTVALKMILAGQLASETDVRRFRAEAEAVANLDHPNILPLYEVGEHHGQHYFSMKLVAGGSLASRIAELQKDPRAAVALLVAVARAVHFAHQRGVLHRDLKPGNVLLEESHGDSLIPYVTDFGLAKRVEGDSGLTASGAIVGTPSYMPPEQARAEKALTVGADVYALGAILYELLTGRPPFRGASQLDTLVQVLEQEPEPPRQVNPAVARDLETVCLKCLAKQPARRYASAGGLADELERWLAGEGVLANPPTRAERFARWGQRNPVQLALVVAMLIGVVSAAVVPQSTEGPLPRGVLTAGFLTAFFAFMMLLGRSQLKSLEKRLRREGPAAAAEGSAVAALPAPPAGAVSRGELLRALGRGARNGAFLGVGAATSLMLLPWVAGALIHQQGARVRVNLSPAVVAAVLVVAVLAGAVGAVLARVLIRPFGRIAWGTAWLMAGIAVVLGTNFVLQFGLLQALGKWQLLMLVIGPAGAVYYDWWTRSMRGMTRHTAAAGQIPPESARIVEGMIPPSDAVVKHLPVLLLVGGVIAGHFCGAAVGRTIAPEVIAEVGADLGALAGRVAGALAGALLAVGLLRLYRVEEGTPWPGQGERPYPRALAAVYLSATAVLAAVWFL